MNPCVNCPDFVLKDLSSCAHENDCSRYEDHLYAVNQKSAQWAGDYKGGKVHWPWVDEDHPTAEERAYEKRR